MFRFIHHNRLKFPQKHVVVCEDVLSNQAAISAHLRDLFEHEGNVQVSFVCGALAAAAIMGSMHCDLVLLDRDMPHGNGDDLLNWMRSNGKIVPVITFSGIPGNNYALMAMGASYHFQKGAVINGAADDVIVSIVGR